MLFNQSKSSIRTTTYISFFSNFPDKILVAFFFLVSLHFPCDYWDQKLIKNSQSWWWWMDEKWRKSPKYFLFSLWINSISLLTFHSISFISSTSRYFRMRSLLYDVWIWSIHDLEIFFFRPFAASMNQFFFLSTICMRQKFGPHFLFFFSWQIRFHQS